MYLIQLLPNAKIFRSYSINLNTSFFLPFKLSSETTSILYFHHSTSSASTSNADGAPKVAFLLDKSSYHEFHSQTAVVVNLEIW